MPDPAVATKGVFRDYALAECTTAAARALEVAPQRTPASRTDPPAHARTLRQTVDERRDSGNEHIVVVAADHVLRRGYRRR
jgi:ADP-glucose pyrophosphorylase